MPEYGILTGTKIIQKQLAEFAVKLPTDRKFTHQISPYPFPRCKLQGFSIFSHVAIKHRV